MLKNPTPKTLPTKATDTQMNVGDSYNYILPALPHYQMPIGTILRVVDDHGPRSDDDGSGSSRSFEAEVISIPYVPKVVTINVPKGTTVKIVEV